MPAPALGKICTVCGKDVSQLARVKDAKGQYYCQPCGASRSKPVVQAPAPLDDLDLAPVEATPVKRTAVATRSLEMQAAPRPLAVPVKSKAAPAETPVVAERMANMTIKLMKWGFYLAIVAFVVFSAYGLYLMFGAPKGAFDDFPTTHEQLIKDFLADINTGTDKSYDKAFLLISFRERLSNRADEADNFKSLFKKMHDTFVSKHGAQWINSVDVKKQGLNDIGSTDEDVTYTVKIGDMEYHIGTQVQIAVDQMIANLPNIRDRKTYPEDGKNHFGITEMWEFPIDWRRKGAPGVEPPGPDHVEPGPGLGIGE